LGFEEAKVKFIVKDKFSVRRSITTVISCINNAFFPYVTKLAKLATLLLFG